MFRRKRTYLVSYRYYSKGEEKMATGFGSVEWTTRNMNSSELTTVKEEVGHYLHRENPSIKKWDVIVLSIYKLDK